MDAQNSKTAYEILHVPPRASSDTIAKAFKELAWKLHPDKNADSTGFSEITAAYTKIKTLEARQRYDAELGDTLVLCEVCRGTGNVVKLVNFSTGVVEKCEKCSGHGTGNAVT